MEKLEKKKRHMYEAAVRYGLSSVENRTFEEWETRVSDWGLEDAEQALVDYVVSEHTRLRREVAVAAKAYSLSARVFKVESDKILAEGIDPRNPMEMSSKLKTLRNTYGDAMRRTGNVMDETVDALIGFETEYDLAGDEE